MGKEEVLLLRGGEGEGREGRRREGEGRERDKREGKGKMGGDWPPI